MQANNVNQRRRAQGSAFKNALSALWHLPDRFHWMAPLPIHIVGAYFLPFC